MSHQSLETKMKIYNFSDQSMGVMSSYLSFRSQAVMVGGKLSDFLWVKNGVAQGSIIGPLMYNLYTQEIPHILDMECPHRDSSTNESEYLFEYPCVNCGTSFSYADDTSINIQIHSGDTDKKVAYKVDTILSFLEEFLRLNNLKMNTGKTVIMGVTPRQKCAKNSEGIKLNTKNDKGKNIEPSECAKLLGITLNKNLNWSYHLEKGKQGIINKCKKKLGALKYVANQASLDTKKRLVEGCIMSVLTYGIQCWGLMAPKTTLLGVQRVQNLAACWTLSKPKWTKTSQLLSELNWMSIFQLTFYHSLTSIWNIFKNGEPHNNMKNLTENKNNSGRIKLTSKIWSKKAKDMFFQLPTDVTSAKNISIFKRRLKDWILKNIPIRENENETKSNA